MQWAEEGGFESWLEGPGGCFAVLGPGEVGEDGALRPTAPSLPEGFVQKRMSGTEAAGGPGVVAGGSGVACVPYRSGTWAGVGGGQSNDPRNNQRNPRYANYWAPLTRKRHIPPHPAQPRHTDHWAPRTRKRHQQEHRPQRPTESNDPTQHAKGRMGDRPGPRKETTTRRNVTQGVGQRQPKKFVHPKSTSNFGAL